MPAILVHVPTAPLLNGHPKAEQMSRIQRDLVTTTGSDTSDEAMLRRIMTKGKKPRVAIIGAGFAGLRAADVLLQHGVPVTIFEARNRVGGRLCQEKVGQHVVDMGPNWIHGTKNNPILDLVRQTQTPTHDWGERQAAFGPDGKLIPETEAAENSEILWELIGDAFKFSNAHSADIDPSESLMNYVKKHVDEKLSKRGLNDEGKKDLIMQAAEMWGGFIGATTAEQSLKFLWLEECLDGENLFCAGTYAKVLELVQRPALEKADVRFNAAVERIVSRNDEGKVEVEVRTKTGVVECFDEVVVTCPLGWLKRMKDDVFEPKLPERIDKAIAELGYGNLDKVYITFPTAFWDTPLPQPETHDTTNAQDQIPNFAATTLPLHQPSSNGSKLETTEYTPSFIGPSNSQTPSSKASDHYVGFTTFIAPTYAPDTNPSGWIQDCVNLAALPPSCAHPTLLFYISGPTSTHISTLLSSHQDPKAALYSFFQPYVSHLPNYTPACEPLAILATNWMSDEYAGWGSYTNFPVGSNACDEDVTALREGKGCTERGIWFAGEHVAPFVALGTVTGAYWAGEAVGKRMVAAYGL